MSERDETKPKKTACTDGRMSSWMHPTVCCWDSAMQVREKVMKTER